MYLRRQIYLCARQWIEIVIWPPLHLICHFEIWRKPKRLVIDSPWRWEYGFSVVVTNNIKPVPIRYVSLSPSLTLLLPLSLSLSFIRPPLFVIVEEVGCSFPSPPAPLPSLLHIHFMLNWWIKLSLAQNQSWLAFPYSFTLDHNPRERETERERREREREREREGGREGKRESGRERERMHWDTDKAQSHYMSF